MDKSRIGAECVNAPMEIRSTPVAATSATFSSVIPPDASSNGRFFCELTLFHNGQAAASTDDHAMAAAIDAGLRDRLAQAKPMTPQQKKVRRGPRRR